MATFRGLDGSVQNGANPIGEVLSWELNASRDLLEDTVMGDTSKTFKAGLGENDITLGMRLDYGDAEQAAILDDIFAATATTFSLDLQVDGTDKMFEVDAVATGANVTAQLGNIVEAQITMKGASAITVTWA